MWTDEAICSESKRGWVTKLRTKAEPLSSMLLASAQGDPFSFPVTERSMNCSLNASNGTSPKHSKWDFSHFD